jgi:hypothetical protein
MRDVYSFPPIAILNSFTSEDKPVIRVFARTQGRALLASASLGDNPSRRDGIPRPSLLRRATQPYAPIAFCSALAMVLTWRSMASSNSASTITRASFSVPE